LQQYNFLSEKYCIIISRTVLEAFTLVGTQQHRKFGFYCPQPGADSAKDIANEIEVSR